MQAPYALESLARMVPPTEATAHAHFYMRFEPATATSESRPDVTRALRPMWAGPARCDADGTMRHWAASGLRTLAMRQQRHQSHGPDGKGGGGGWEGGGGGEGAPLNKKPSMP